VRFAITYIIIYSIKIESILINVISMLNFYPFIILHLWAKFNFKYKIKLIKLVKLN